MTSVTVTWIVRAAGFVAYTCVVTVIPSGEAADLVQVTVIVAGSEVGASAAHTSPKFTLAGEPSFVSSHVTVAFSTADISLSRVCARISFTGIDTSLAPMPAVLNDWFRRSACKDEPGHRCDPTARRPYQS